MEHFGMGELYYLTRASGDVRFVKILNEGGDPVYIRGFIDPPSLRWWTDPGIPLLQIEPAGNDRSGDEMRVIETSHAELRGWGPVFLRVASGLYADEAEELHRLGLTRIPVLTGELSRELFAIEPSQDGDLEYRPVRVRLVDGTVVDRVQMVEASSYIRTWWIWPTDDPGKQVVRLSDVSHIEESPARIPARLATKMYEAGESAMGGCFFVLVSADGRRFPCVTGNVVDVVDLPADVRPLDLVDLVPHDRGRPADIRPASREQWIGPSFAWCLYRLPPEMGGRAR
jgi:hypothetical protein